MINRRWLVICLALALAGVMAFAGLGWAQCRGYGPRGQAYQNGQTCWTGGGPGYANCANYSAGPGYGAQGGGNYARGPRNSRWGGGYNCPYNSTTQTTPNNNAPAPQTPQ